MSIRKVSNLSDGDLWRSADKLEADERVVMAQLLVCIAEIDTRKLYAEEGHSSMHACCMERWHMSEDMASRRITAAKAGRRFPVIFQGLADGRFHLTGIKLLAQHLTENNADEVLAEAMNKTKREIEHLIARRFPQPDVPTIVIPVAIAPTAIAPAVVADVTSSAPARMDVPATSSAGAPMMPLATPSTPISPSAAPAYPRVTPRAPERYALQLTMDQETHDLLREAQALSNHPSQSDIPDVLKRALKCYVARLKARKLGATSRPQKKRRESKNVRHVPAEVRRAVVERDQNRCTFLSDAGRRCTATTGLELDHIVPIARGGESTVDNLRQRCKAHNMLEAERVFGAAFMEFKREAAHDARQAGRVSPG